MSSLADRIRIKRRRAIPKVPARTRIVASIVAVVWADWRDGVIPTVFAYEGMITASLRSGLCLQGWAFRDADEAARNVMQEALRTMGAARPRWLEGQREWTDAGVIRETRLHCANCGGPLEEGQKTWCSRTCYNAQLMRQKYQNDLDASRAAQRIRKAAWQAAQPERECEVCGSRFKPKRKEQRLCSATCASAHGRGMVRHGMR